MNWKYVENTNEHYKIYEDGTIERLAFSHVGKDGKTYRLKAKIVKPRKGEYLQVWLSPYGGYYVHRLVAIHFCKKPENYLNLDVDHINCNKHDNYYKNLEFVDRKENMVRASINGLINKSSEKRKKQTALNAKSGRFKNSAKQKDNFSKKMGKIALYNRENEIEEIFDNIYKAIEETGCSWFQVVSCCNNVNKKMKNKKYFRKFSD